MTRQEYYHKRYVVFSEIRQELDEPERCDICGCSLPPRSRGIYCAACAKEQAKIEKAEKKAAGNSATNRGTLLQVVCLSSKPMW